MPDHSQNNSDILKKLESFLDRHPEMRFSQALLNFGFVKEVADKEGKLYWKDEFYTEPEAVLRRLAPDPK